MGIIPPTIHPALPEIGVVQGPEVMLQLCQAVLYCRVDGGGRELRLHEDAEPRVAVQSPVTISLSTLSICCNLEDSSKK